EAGKSSLGEAVRLIFDYQDSSKHSEIKAIKPVNRDEGPEIELEAESGPYAFTYNKRFLKKPETSLEITRPSPENHTAREAHDRAEAILNETLDKSLWRALNIQQGDAIQQPDLTKQTSLSAALDKAAGGRASDTREEGLFEKAEKEYLIYYTPGGAEKKDIQEARDKKESAKAETQRLEQELINIEKDTERAAELKKELEQLKKHESELIKEIEEHAAAIEEITRLEAEIKEAGFTLETVRQKEQAARKDKEERKKQIEAQEKASKEHEQLKEEIKRALDALKKAEDDFKKEQEKYSRAEKRRKENEAIAELRRADWEYYRKKLDLEQLQERKDRIDKAREKARKAEEILAINKVDEAALKSIQDAERAELTAIAQLETGAPSAKLRALKDIQPSIGEEKASMAKGEERTISIPERTRIELPGTMEIEITAGTSAGGLKRKADEARRELEKRCKKAGVNDPYQARKEYEERREALRYAEIKAQVEKENLRDLTYEDLEGKVSGLSIGVQDYLKKRDKEPAISGSMETAKEALAESEAENKKASGEWEEARNGLDAARSLKEGFNTKKQEKKVQLEMLGKTLAQAKTTIEKARESESDKDLEKRAGKQKKELEEQEQRAKQAEVRLKEKNPEKVKAMAETARGSLKTNKSRGEEARTELTEAQAALKIKGEDGLHEKYHSAKTTLAREENENKALARRAEAAKCLFETMREERDKARSAYVAPIKEKIEQLGKLIFDETFQVEISEDLKITRRTQNGVTVPFESLSGGTREQLALIFRLACSMIVARDGGTPVILDDALGYTDPERLKAMGAVLARAAKESQIIIFTCVPERYGNVGEARVVRMALRRFT
ncbi:MAG: hypothetical protein ABIA63_02190, partial [bacterium]